LDEVGRDSRGQRKKRREKHENEKDARIKPGKQERGKAKSSKTRKKRRQTDQGKRSWQKKRSGPQRNRADANQTAKRKQRVGETVQESGWADQGIQRCEGATLPTFFTPHVGENISQGFTQGRRWFVSSPYASQTRGKWSREKERETTGCIDRRGFSFHFLKFFLSFPIMDQKKKKKKKKRVGKKNVRTTNKMKKKLECEWNEEKLKQDEKRKGKRV
jgi:hypothetical protein